MSSDPQHPSQRPVAPLAGLLLLGGTLLLAGCSRGPDPASEAAMMRAGLEALYTRHDAPAAAAQFQGVLARDPAHYGATYQLAVALDQAGETADSQRVWQQVLSLADHCDDTAAVTQARTRLGLPPLRSDEELMRAGLHALYTRHDGAAAAGLFAQVLAHTPTHYGATYQLAVALDAAGQRQAAGAVWRKVLAMADAINDQPTAGTARARLGIPNPRRPPASWRHRSPARRTSRETAAG